MGHRHRKCLVPQHAHACPLPSKTAEHTSAAPRPQKAEKLCSGPSLPGAWLGPHLTWDKPCTTPHCFWPSRSAMPCRKTRGALQHSRCAPGHLALPCKKLCAALQHFRSSTNQWEAVC